LIGRTVYTYFPTHAHDERRRVVGGGAQDRDGGGLGVRARLPRRGGGALGTMRAGGRGRGGGGGRCGCPGRGGWRGGIVRAAVVFALFFFSIISGSGGGGGGVGVSVGVSVLPFDVTRRHLRRQLRLCWHCFRGLLMEGPGLCSRARGRCRCCYLLVHRSPQLERGEAVARRHPRHAGRRRSSIAAS
jgi:hypothetical protein